MSSATTIDFPVAEVFGTAWNRLTAHLIPFVLATLVMAVAIFACAAITTGVVSFMGLILGETLASLVGNLLYIALISLSTGPLSVGLFSMARRASLGQSVSWSDVFSGFDYFQTAVVASLIYSILVALGGLLCVLPGIIVAYLYWLTWIRILDGERRPWQAMESGRRIVMDNLVSWLILFLLLFMVNFAGGLACFVGLLVTVPFSALVITDAYARQLNRV